MFMQTILIVEDQPDVQNLLKLALIRPDRRLMHAMDAVVGLSLARNETPDLVLLDIMMPGRMDGIGLLQALRKDQRTAGTKIIVISARAQHHDRETALAEGADAYITKPFKLSYLKQCIDRLLT
jgi:DNA-binding response OmpR family regulator